MDSQQNPYLPPTSETGEEAILDPFPIILVGSGTRFINFIIDNIVCFALQFVLGTIIILLFKDRGIKHLQTGCISNIYNILITITYYSILEFKYGFTLGKLVTNTRVVNESGDPISLPQAIGRSFSRFVPFEPFSCFGKESRGWHDTWAKTFVIKRRSA